MKILILSLMLGFLTTFVDGQIPYHPFPTDSAEWVMENTQYTGWGGTFYGYNYYLAGDTILNGKQYALVRDDNNGGNIGGIREDSTKKVWFYNLGGLRYCPQNTFDTVLQVGGETMLFDFGLQVGMGYRHQLMQVYDGNHLAQVDSAYSEVMNLDSIQLLDGTFRNVLHIKTTSINPASILDTLCWGSFWVEGIGVLVEFNMNNLGYNLVKQPMINYYKSHSGLFGAFTVSLAGISPPSCGNHITCFIENGIQLLGRNGIAVCDTIVAISMVEDNQVEVVVAPNPFHKQTTINITGNLNGHRVEVLVFNAVGQQVRRIRSTNKEIVIERNQLPVGLYLYQVLGDDQVLATGKLVIH